MPLRDYQIDCLDRSLEHYEKGLNRQLAVLSTGLGKTAIAANIRSHHGFHKKLMFCCHMETLAVQAATAMQRWNPSLRVGVEMAGSWVDMDGLYPPDVIVASVPTLGRKGSDRIRRFDPFDFDCLIQDEAHLSPSDSFKRVYDHFGLLEPNPDGILFLGITATPNRADGKGLRELFDVIVFDMGIQKGIADGWLCDLVGYRVDGKAKLDGIKTRMGDFAQDELEKSVNTPERNAIIVKEWYKIAYGKRTLAFTVDVQHALDLAAAFTAHGEPAQAVWGDDPDRHQKIRGHKTGEFNVLCNCNVLCLDTETEILTDRGWTKYNEMTFDRRVANWCFNGEVFFKKPQAILVRPLAADEHMISVQSKTVNLRVTNNHRMVVSCGEARKNWKKIAADNLTNRDSLPTNGLARPFPMKVNREGKPVNSARRISANAYNLRNLAGYEYAESFREAKKREEARRSLRWKDPSELSEDECRLIGFWVADGSVARNRKGGGVAYTLCQSTTYPSIVTEGTELLWGLNEAQFDALVEGYWYGDGSHGQATKGRPNSLYFADTKKPWIELLCAIGSVRGWRCTVTEIPARKENHNTQWGLRMIKGKRITLSCKTPIIHEPHTEEMVWCVTTDSHNIITRRNGKVVVTGNSIGYDDPEIQCIISAAPTKSELRYVQQVGRGTRISPGKSECTVIDVVDNCKKHSLTTISTLLGLPKDLDLKGEKYSKARERIDRMAAEFPTANIQDIKSLNDLKSIAENIQLFQPNYPPEIARLSELGWRKSAEGYMLAVNRDLVTITKDLREEWQVRGKVGEAVADFSAQNLPGAMNIADRFVLEHGGIKPILARDSRWHHDPPTEKQLGLARVLKIVVPPGTTKGQLSHAIDVKMMEKRRA